MSRKWTRPPGPEDVVSGREAFNVARVRDALVSLGVGVMHARVYCALLRKSNLTATELAEETEISRGHIYEVLNELHESAMVASHAGKVHQYSAYQPAIVLPAIADKRERELAEKRSTFSRIFAGMEFRGSSLAESPIRERLRILYTDHEIAEFQTRLFRKARKAFLLFEQQTLFPARGPEEMQGDSWYEEKSRAMGACSDARIVIDAKILQNSILRRRVDAAADRGMTLRVARSLPFHALVIDGKHVLMNLPESPALPTNPQVYLNHPGLAASLGEEFERQWKRAQAHRRATP